MTSRTLIGETLLADLEAEVDRLNRVVNDLLTYGRPHPAARGTVPVREVLRRTAALLQPAAAERGVKVAVTGDSTLALYADEDHVQQVLVNLGLNAVQACGAGGAVTLRAARRGNWTTIEITDDGCGIPPEHLARITDPFYTTKPTGSGLGLTISQQMVEANGERCALRASWVSARMFASASPQRSPDRIIRTRRRDHADDFRSDRG